MAILNFEEMMPIDGGYHVKVTDDGKYCIDIYRMMYNWRLTISEIDPERPHENGHLHGWCYYGHGAGRSMHGAMLAATFAAAEWDGVGEPDGFDKRAF